MIISELRVENFRNLSGLHIKNDQKVKFIIGENGVGKSNIIEMLNIIFNRNSFSEQDFKNENEAVIVEITLQLEKTELGYFDDLFEVEDPDKIEILAIQDQPDDRIEFKHKGSGSNISYKKIKDIPFVYYSSTKAPTDLDFNKTKATGNFLNQLVNDYIVEKEIHPDDLVKGKEIDMVVDYINAIIYHIEFINKNDIHATLENDILSLLPRLLALKDSNEISVNDMGDGIRYSSFIYFEILNRILGVVKQNSHAIIVDEEGRKHLPIIIALDEPEIHLHPFMQRNIIVDIRNIISNKDKGFSELIKVLFGIDYLTGELIVATHSPNIISNNYKEYIRLYQDGNIIKNESGVLLELPSKEEKTLLAHAYSIRESFFARVVIIIEGDTELGAMPVFAETMGCNLDSYGIGIISAGGATTIPKLKKMLAHFGIQSICIVDKDEFRKREDKYKGMLHTEEEEFEADVIETLIRNNALHEIKGAIEVLDKDGLDKEIQYSQLNNINKKYKFKEKIGNSYRIGEALDSGDENLIRLVLISWMSGFKNSAEGRILAEHISEGNIPKVYKTAIKEAKDVSENV